MTPKEKAKDLHFKMKIQMKGPGIEAGHGNARRCALIAVEEIVEAIKSVIGSEEYQWLVSEKETIDYWQKVKQEIEKL